jgi:hypothetical protein
MIVRENGQNGSSGEIAAVVTICNEEGERAEGMEEEKLV